MISSKLAELQVIQQVQYLGPADKWHGMGHGMA